MKLNKKAEDYRVDKEVRVAGGGGARAAVQKPEALLRRSVMANLLWEDAFYEDGHTIADNIAALVPQVEAEACAKIAVEARFDQKLRHVPLLIVREMARHTPHKHEVGGLLPRVINRPDEITEFLSIYWKDGKCPLSAQVKKGLAAAFWKFDEYALAKYDRPTEIKLRDVLFLVHGGKRSEGAFRVAGAIDNPSYKRGPTYRHVDSLAGKIVDGKLATPDTWEVALSGSEGTNKKEHWTRLITEKKLGALAYVRNLRNMIEAGVGRAIIKEGLRAVNPAWLLPLNFLSAAKAAPDFQRELEQLMWKCFSFFTKLRGHTVFVVDVSGSMQEPMSGKSTMNRLGVASALTMLASEMCEDVSIYVTAGADYTRIHNTRKLRPYRGFAMCEAVQGALHNMGGGGIFTRQCLEFIKDDQGGQEVDRIIVVSDSQDCDYPDKRIPAPFGDRNYIIDVSPHSRGIAYDGVWDAEISGWSERFLHYIAELEAPLSLQGV